MSRKKAVNEQEGSDLESVIKFYRMRSSFDIVITVHLFIRNPFSDKKQYTVAFSDVYVLRRLSVKNNSQYKKNYNILFHRFLHNFHSPTGRFRTGSSKSFCRSQNTGVSLCRDAVHRRIVLINVLLYCKTISDFFPFFKSDTIIIR